MVTSAVVGPGSEPPRVGYAIGRGVGGAVVRNRVRRRLRAATRAHAAELVPGHAYLVGAGPAASQRSYAELSIALHDALSALREETS
jgi:ribonuclease P protein component